MSDSAELFGLTTAAVAPIVDTRPDPLAETPCSDWNYAQLLGHVVGGDRLFCGILTGVGKPLPTASRMAPDADQPPPSPQDYRTWTGRLAEALAEPAVQAGTYDLPVGRLPGAQVALLRSTEHLLHGWDLAKSAGAPTTMLEPVAEVLTGPALRLLGA